MPHSTHVAEILGRVFFVHDRSLSRDESDPYTALFYFYPEQVRPDVQGLLSGQLIGMSNLLEDLNGKFEPQVIGLRNDYYVLLRVGKYCMALGATYDIPEAVSHRHLASMYAAFCFFRGGFRTARETTVSPGSNSDTRSVSALQVIASFQHENGFNGSFTRTFDWAPHTHMDKLPAEALLQARFLLQASYRKPAALAGAVLFGNKIVVADVSDDLIEPLLFFKLLDDASRLKLAECLRASSELPSGSHLLRVYALASSVRTMRENNCMHIHNRHLSTAMFRASPPAGEGRGGGLTSTFGRHFDCDRGEDNVNDAAATIVPDRSSSGCGATGARRPVATAAAANGDDDDRVPLALHFQQLGTHMTLMMLYDCLQDGSGGLDDAVMVSTRKDVLEGMATIEDKLCERVGQAAEAASSLDQSLAYFHHCSLTHEARSRLVESTRDGAVNADMLDSSRAIHDVFARSSAVRRVVLWNQSGGTGGSRGQGTETYFQHRGPPSVVHPELMEGPVHLPLYSRVWPKLQAELGSRLL